MRRKFPWWSVIGIILVIAGIAAYNIWAYNCGYCAIQDMKTIGPQTSAVGFLVLVAAVTWIVLRIMRMLNKNDKMCRCGRLAAPDWLFCPDCGVRIEKTSF